jgi:hypothetical protein
VTEADAIEAIEAAWVAQWPTLQPTVPFALDNESFTTVSTWARVSVLHTTSIQASHGGLGSRRWERAGNIWVQLFGEVDVGRKALSLLVADVRSIYEGVQLASPIAGDEPVVTGALATRESPTDNRWLMQTCVVPFYYYALR